MVGNIAQQSDHPVTSSTIRNADSRTKSETPIQRRMRIVAPRLWRIAGSRNWNGWRRPCRDYEVSHHFERVSRSCFTKLSPCGQISLHQVPAMPPRSKPATRGSVPDTRNSTQASAPFPRFWQHPERTLTPSRFSFLTHSIASEARCVFGACPGNRALLHFFRDMQIAATIVVRTELALQIGDQLS